MEIQSYAKNNNLHQNSINTDNGSQWENGNGSMHFRLPRDFPGMQLVC